ncbi:glucosamine-6-phosphate deaminase [candidate division WOR-3 bacterium]|nr:glucosamine-6-phosphate deaminase [candidate division WOR-3 bacterium]
MRLIIKKDYRAMSKKAAKIVAEQIREKPDSVLGLATGSTVIGTYKELIRIHKKEGLDFSEVTTFNLDEYYPIPSTHPQSYHYFIHKELFNHINIDPDRIHIPDGLVKNTNAFCQWYEDEIKKAGGIDLQLLGIGKDGHIGFNEPGSSLGSRTRIKTLTAQTIKDNAQFFKKKEDVPKFAITIGVGTILDAKRCLLLASGKNKAKVLKKAIEGPITAQVTASVLQMHKELLVIADEEASSALERKEYYQHIEELTGKLKTLTLEED